MCDDSPEAMCVFGWKRVVFPTSPTGAETALVRLSDYLLSAEAVCSASEDICSSSSSSDSRKNACLPPEVVASFMDLIQSTTTTSVDRSLHPWLSDAVVASLVRRGLLVPEPSRPQLLKFAVPGWSPFIWNLVESRREITRRLRQSRLQEVPLASLACKRRFNRSRMPFAIVFHDAIGLGLARCSYVNGKVVGLAAV